MALTWLGCYLHINEAFTKTKRRMLWTFIPTIFVIFCISIILIDNCIGKERSGKEKKSIWFFIFNIPYIPFITFYCFILTNFTKYEYILIVLSLIIINFLLLEIYHSFILTNEYFLLTFLPLLIANILLIVLYSYLWIEKVSIIISISIISLFIILYIIFINYLMKEFEEEEYMFGVFAISYGIFTPSTFIIVLSFAGLIISINFIITKIKK